VAPPAIVWLPRPGTGLTARPRALPRLALVQAPPVLPMLQLPALPPLGLVRPEPAGQPNRAEKKKQAAPGLALNEPPPLLRLRGVTGLNPLLEGIQESLAQQPRAAVAELLPESVVAAPPLSPLPGLRSSDRGLLPTLDRDGRERDAFDPSARPSALDLVLQPPPLPDVFLR
jgi:hypothetical protein